MSSAALGEVVEASFPCLIVAVFASRSGTARTALHPSRPSELQGWPLSNPDAAELHIRSAALALELCRHYNVGMARDLRFEWDPAKARTNLRRHGVGFSEASSVFLDEHALLIDDPDHSAAEDRFVLLGLSATLRLLIVCHCYRAEGGVVRIISARKADRQERRDYFGRLRT